MTGQGAGHRKVALMYSGGTDSTAAAALVAKEFDKVHLVTCKHSGIYHLKHSATNVPKLAATFGETKFIHHFIYMDRLFKLVARERYLGSIRKHGFLMLGNCGLCKLSMHLATLLYCLEHDIHWVADGANIHMDVFPAQMAPVIAELKAMYARFGVTYFNPVFELDYPSDADWTHKLGLHELAGVDAQDDDDDRETAGKLIHRLGLTPEENVKGTEHDRTMQARCFQLFLFNVMVHWYYLPKVGKEEYQNRTVAFYAERIAHFSDLVQAHVDDPSAGPLAGRISISERLDP